MMKLTIEDNPETIKRYRHLRPAAILGGVRCSVRCPGTQRTCTLERGHRGHHVSHGWFQRVVAVWDARGQTSRSEEQVKRTGGAPARTARGGGGPGAALKAIGVGLRRRAPSVEGLVLLVLGLSMALFAVRWMIQIFAGG